MPEISEQDLARLRKELRRANDTIERHGRTFSLIREILQVSASNLRLMQIAGPARRILNLLPPMREDQNLKLLEHHNL